MLVYKDYIWIVKVAQAASGMDVNPVDAFVTSDFLFLFFVFSFLFYVISSVSDAAFIIFLTSYTL